MTRSLRRKVALLVAVFVAVSVTACTSNGDDTSASQSGVVNITLSHGYTDVEAKAITAQVDKWNATHPEIQVKLLSTAVTTTP